MLDIQKTLTELQRAVPEPERLKSILRQVHHLNLLCPVGVEILLKVEDALNPVKQLDAKTILVEHLTKLIQAIEAGGNVALAVSESKAALEAVKL